VRRVLRFVVISSMAVIISLAALTGCLTSFGDTPLGAIGDHRVVAPGEPITGEVVNPDGEIHVTLAPATAPYPEDGKNSPGARGCRYDDGDYSCSSSDLAEGVYRVEVTDEKWPSEGVHFVEVVVTGVVGYDPAITLSDDKRTAILTGWAPGREVTLTVTDRNLGRRVAGPLTGTPDADGRLALRLGTVAPGNYEFEATDGLWPVGNIDNGWDPLFLTI
jgi:hypothetical protein